MVVEIQGGISDSRYNRETVSQRFRVPKFPHVDTFCGATMLEYGLRRVALHLDPQRPQRDPWDFHYVLLVS